MAIPTTLPITYKCEHTEQRDLAEVPAGKRTQRKNTPLDIAHSKTSPTETKPAETSPDVAVEFGQQQRRHAGERLQSSQNPLLAGYTYQATPPATNQREMRAQRESFLTQEHREEPATAIARGLWRRKAATR